MAAPLKVGFVVPGVYAYFNPAVPWPPGGSERQAYLLGRAMAARGDVAVHYAVADFGQPPRESPLPGVELWRAFRYGDSPLRALPMLAATLRAMDADVYVFRSASTGVAVGMWLAARRCRKPVVYMLANDGEAENRRLASWLGWGGTLAMAWAYALPRAICAQSAAQGRAFATHRRAVAAVVPNACEMPPAEALLPIDARRNVLWVGRAQELKRGDAFVALAKRAPEMPFVMICSSSDAACEERWRAAAAGVPNLAWHGALPHAALTAHYAAARLFVSTSRTEGVPNTMLEAMGAGCPVLSAMVDPGGVLAACGAGRCVGSLDEAALAHACAEMLADKDALAAMSRAARAFVGETHSPAAAADALARVLHEVCGAKGATPCAA